MRRSAGLSFMRTSIGQMLARVGTPRAALVALLICCGCARGQIVRRPALASHAVDFEGLSSVCDFADGVPLSDEYAARSVAFSGPGFGGLNGGVAANWCTLGTGRYPPLGNHSFDGLGFLGFSALSAFNLQTGKPIAPETVRFDVRVTNIVASFAGIDGHYVTVELWSGPALSFNDKGELLKSLQLQMTPSLQAFTLADENDLFVDCVRRIVITSPAKLFILDNLHYDITQADDSTCGPEPGASATTSPPPPSSAAPAAATPSRSARAVGCSVFAAAVLIVHIGSLRTNKRPGRTARRT